MTLCEHFTDCPYESFNQPCQVPECDQYTDTVKANTELYREAYAKLKGMVQTTSTSRLASAMKRYDQDNHDPRYQGNHAAIRDELARRTV